MGELRKEIPIYREQPFFNKKGGATLLLLGLLGLLVLAGAYELMRTHDANLKSNKSLSQQIEVDMLVNQIKIYLRSKESCNYSFRNKTIGDDSTTEFRFFSSSNGSPLGDGNHVFRTGEKIPIGQGKQESIIKLSRIRLTEPSASWLGVFRPIGYPAIGGAPPMKTLFVELRFVKDLQKSALTNLMGMYEIFRYIPIEVSWQTAAPNKIESCFYDSNNDSNMWVKNSCESLLGGTLLNSMCTHINLKESVSTEGSFCFNEVNGDESSAGNIHNKDCVSSWYLKNRDCYGIGPSPLVRCNINEVMAGFSTISCGKGCISAMAICCKSRLLR